MKPKNIQLNIRSRSEREVGQAPGIGKVSRLRDHGLLNTGDPMVAGKTAGYETSDLQNPALRKLILLWSAIFVVAALAAILFWIVPTLHRRSAAAAESAPSDDALVRVASKFPSPSESEAVNLVKRAISNRDPAKVAKLFRMGSASAAEVIAFCKDSEQRDGAIERYDWLSSMDVDGLLIDGVNVVYQGQGKPSERLALLTPNSTGVWKLDFDSFARSTKPSWKEILANTADHAMVRVLVGSDAYYNGTYTDETQWICYGIASPDIEESLRGYCRVGSEEASAMDHLFSDRRQISRATLEIRHIKEADPRQFEITRVLAKDWVTPD